MNKAIEEILDVFHSLDAQRNGTNNVEIGLTFTREVFKALGRNGYLPMSRVAHLELSDELITREQVLEALK